MAIIEKEIRNTLFGVGIGAGAVLVLRFVAPVVVAIARPLTKALIAATLDGFEKATHQLAVAAENFQDIVAETRADRALVAPPATVVTASGSHEVN
jgi:hypothetical protein